MKKISILLFLVLLLSAPSVFSQCGDHCLVATPLNVTDTGGCSYDSCTNVGSTPSGITTFPCSGVNNNDVWFTFLVPPGVTSLTGRVEGTGMTNPIVYFYRGSCAAVASIGCASGSPPASLAELTVLGLIPGEQIWVRVKPIGGTPDGGFRICVFNPCPNGAPVYDEPCNALFLPQSSSCSGFTTVTNQCASSTTGVTPPGCGIFGGTDIWVASTVAANGHLGIAFERQTMQDVECAAYGGSCDSLELLACEQSFGNDSMPDMFLTGLTPGDSVWIRIWTFNNLSIGTTGVCFYDPCPSSQALHDDPCQALYVPMDSICHSLVSLTNICAGNTTGVPNPSCPGYAGHDIWVQTSVGSNGHLEIELQEAGLLDPAIAVYTGTCNALIPVDCDNNSGAAYMPYIYLTTLPPNAQVWIRIWTYRDTLQGTMGICLSDPCPQNVNSYDEPCTAQFLPVTENCDNYVVLTSACATSSATVPPPSCGFYSGGDVWVQTVIGLSGHLEINLWEQTVADAICAVYTGRCDSLTEVACDDNSGRLFMPHLFLTNLTPGSTVWIRIYSYLNGMQGDFKICLSDPCPAMPLYDEPCNALYMPVDSVCNAYASINNVCATTSTGIPAPGCGQFMAWDMWLRTTVGHSGSVTLNFLYQTLNDPAVAVYTGTCNDLSLLACDDDSGAGLQPWLELTGLAPGTQLWIRIWTYSLGDPGYVGLCISEPVPGDTLHPPHYDDPPCPMPSASSNFLHADTCAVYHPFSSLGANVTTGTIPPGLPMPVTCPDSTYPPGAFTGWDTWTSLVIPPLPSSGYIDLLTQEGTVNNLDMALYRIQPPIYVNCGTAGQYVLVACDDEQGPGRMPYLRLPYGGANTLQPGDTCMLRMWSHFGGPAGNWFLSYSVSRFDPVDMCLVTVDPLLNKNKVTWSKNSTTGLDSILIYKEQNVAGIFQRIAAVAAGATAQFTDQSSLPSLLDCRYRVGLLDSCGFEFPTITTHRTMHLQVEDLGGSWKLDWNASEGIPFTSYDILRGSSLATLTVIDSVPASQHTYIDASSPGLPVYYAIQVKKPSGCFAPPLSPSFASQSNIFGLTGTGIPDNNTALMDLYIFPNPAENNAVLECIIQPGQWVALTVFDMTGRVVKVFPESFASTGKLEIMWDVRSQSSGLYYVSMSVGDKRIMKKVLVVKP